MSNQLDLSRGCPSFFLSRSFPLFSCSFTFGLLAFFVVCLSVICEFVSRSGVSHSLSNSVKLISAVSFGNCPCDNRYNQKPVLELAIMPGYSSEWSVSLVWSGLIAFWLGLVVFWLCLVAFWLCLVVFWLCLVVFWLCLMVFDQVWLVVIWLDYTWRSDKGFQQIQQLLIII